MKTENCPCKWKNCKRHGDCKLCRDHHASHPKYKQPFCEKKKKKSPSLPK